MLPATSSRLFSASITLLAQELEQAKGQLVLISRLLPSGRLYAVERVQPSIYALCRLGDWVKEEELRVSHGQLFLSGLEDSPIKNRKPSAGRGSSTWWSSTEIQKCDVHPPHTKSGERGIRARKLLRPCSDPGSLAEAPSTSNKDVVAARSELGVADVPYEVNEPAIEPLEPANSEQAPEEVFEKLRVQYLDTLYISKVREICVAMLGPR